MTHAVTLLLGVHAHQPVGNFPEVIEDAHLRCYKPFLETLYAYPDFRFAAHFSGWLLDWLRERYPADMTEADLVARIAALNADATVHGILVQLPLPAHMDSHAVIEAIAPQKDVDGFHVASAGALMVGQPGFRPCTPYGCMKMLESIGMQDLRGKHAVVIGRSNIVGKPMAMMLLAANATVTICHSGTPDVKAQTLQGDIVVAAVGKRNVLTADMVKPGAVVIDVGINRDDAGKLCGDVDFAGVKEVAGWITPVPGGVGPMTRAMLLVNTIEAAEQASA